MQIEKNVCIIHDYCYLCRACENEVLWFERDILPQMAGSDDVHVYQTANWWSPVKTAASAVYANRHYLQLYKTKRPERLASSAGGSVACNIIGNVFIHPTARIHSSAVIGPNVSVGAHVEIGEGARVKVHYLIIVFYTNP